MFKKKYLKIELMYGDQSQGSYLEPADRPAFIEVENDTYKISLVKMTEKEFKALSEFTGF